MAPHPLTRRTFLAAGAAGVGGLALGGLAGCTGDRGRGSDDRSAASKDLNLLVVTPKVRSGRPDRLVFVLQDADREPVVPKRATFRFGRTPEQMQTPPAEAQIRTDAAPATPYLTVNAELSPPGTVWAEITADGRRAVAPITIADDVPGVDAGQPLPAVATPTTGDLAGLEVACTRQPACPLHATSLDAALATRRPLAVLVATPAFCQTAVCGPVLDVLLAAMPAYDGRVGFLHLEVYAQRPKDRIEGTPLAPAVKAFGLESEPTLYLVGADGLVRTRLDGVIGTGELTESLAALTA